MNIEIPRDKVTDFCRRWQVNEFTFFGSVLRDDFKPESDLDVLVNFEEKAPWSLLDFVRMQDELEEIFGRKVDLVEKDALRNPFRKHIILRDSWIIYAN